MAGRNQTQQRSKRARDIEKLNKSLGRPKSYGRPSHIKKEHRERNWKR